MYSNVCRWLLPILLFTTHQVGAVDFTVTRLDDPTPNGCLPGDCSLREAVIATNALFGADRIVLPAGVLQLTIPRSGPSPDVNTGDLEIYDDVEIVGAGATSTAIIAENADRLFNVTPGSSLVLRQVELSGGQSGFGGAILQNGALTIEDSILIGNTASGDGGAIRNSSGSELILRRVQLLNNISSGDGGAVNSGSAGVLVEDSVIGNNKGVNGGAIFGNAIHVYRSLIENNQATTGSGGGIYSSGNCSCTSAEIHESTLSGNSAHINGGGVFAPPPLDVELSTFSANTAVIAGGAIYATTTGGGSSGNGFHIYSSTLYLNTAASGSALAFYDDVAGSGAPPDFKNTVISGTCSQSGTGPGETNGLLGNIESPGNTCHTNGTFINGAFSTYNVPAANLKLGALADNGGPTPTHLPLTGSAVINTGWDLVCTKLDQRGYVRVDADCDSGAVEASAIDDVIFRDGFEL